MSHWNCRKCGEAISCDIKDCPYCNPPAPRFTAPSDPPPFGERIKQKRATTTSDPQWEDVDNPDYWEPAAAPSELVDTDGNPWLLASKPAQPSSDEARDAQWNIYSRHPMFNICNAQQIYKDAWDACAAWMKGKTR